MKPSNKSTTGRPSVYTEEIGQEICERLMSGESLRSICEAESMPGRTTVFRWLAEDEFKSFRDHYTLARKVQADILAEEIIEIADDSSGDTTRAEDGTLQVDHERIARARLRVDARKWYAGKLEPKKYGDRQQIDMEVKDVTPLADRMQKARERAKQRET